MLIIKRRHMAVRAVVAGAIMFTLGMMGVAAYTYRSLEHENLVFDKEQTQKPSASGPASQDAVPTTQTAAPSRDATSPQVTGSSTMPAPRGSQSVAPTSPAIAESSGPTPAETPTPTPGRGGGSSQLSSSDSDSGSGGSRSGDATNVVETVLEILPSL